MVLAAGRYAAASKHPGKKSIMKQFRKEWNGLKSEGTMIDYHSHLHRLVEAREGVIVEDHMHHFRVLSGTRPARPSLEEVLTNVTEHERRALNVLAEERGEYKLVKKPGEDYWYVKVGDKTIGVISRHRDGYDADTDPDGGGDFKKGFESPEKAAEWIARRRDQSEDIDIDALEVEIYEMSYNATEIALAEQGKWIQGAVKRPGRLRKYFGMEVGEKIPMGRLVSACKKLQDKEDKSSEETSLMRAMALGIRLKGGDVPGGGVKLGLHSEDVDELEETASVRQMSDEDLKKQYLQGKERGGIEGLTGAFLRVYKEILREMKRRGLQEGYRRSNKKAQKVAWMSAFAAEMKKILTGKVTLGHDGVPVGFDWTSPEYLYLKGVDSKEAARKAAKLHLKESVLSESEIAATILKQMGGSGRLKAMLGAKNFLDHGKALSFKFPNRKSSRGNYVKITLRPDDTYDMEFSKIVKYDAKLVKKYSGIYADQLKSIFERQTGLRVSLHESTESIEELLDEAVEVDAAYAKAHAVTNPDQYERVFDSLKSKQTVWVSYSAVMSMASKEFRPYTVGRRSHSKKYNVSSITLLRPGQKSAGRVFQIKLMRRGSGKVGIALGDMGASLLGLYVQKARSVKEEVQELLDGCPSKDRRSKRKALVQAWGKMKEHGLNNDPEWMARFNEQAQDLRVEARKPKYSGSLGKGRSSGIRFAQKVGLSKKESEKLIQDWESGWGVLNAPQAKASSLKRALLQIQKRFGDQT